MEIINYSIDWARGEVFSARVIALISVFVLLCAAGFFFWGKTSMARAYWLPLALSGVFLVVVAGGLYYANHPRITSFQEQYRENPEQFVKSELELSWQQCSGNVALMAVGLFGLIRSIKWQGGGLLGRFVSDAARKGYAIYLAHLIILSELTKLLIGSIGPVAVEVPVISFVIFLLTYLPVVHLSLLPKSEKWLGN